MAQDDPSYIAARELDKTLEKLRGDLCECQTKAKAAEKKSDPISPPLQWLGATLLALAAFWLLSFCSGTHHH